MIDSSHLLSLSAMSASTAVLACMTGDPAIRITGVHTEALTLAIGTELCTLVGYDVGNLPRGIVVEHPRRMDWKSTGLRPGDTATVTGRWLRLGASAQVDLAPARPWQARRRLNGRWGPTSDVDAALDGTAAILRGAPGLASLGEHFRALGEGIAPAISQGDWIRQHAARAMAVAVREAKACNPSEFLSTATGLLGLGIGLTPSGDDFLVGLVGSLVLIADWMPALEWVHLTGRELAEEASGRTTAVAASYLRCAARGEIIERQEELLQAAISGDGSTAVAACRTLRRFGHSSGGEIALGTLLAVDIAASLSHRDLALRR